ncbi:MAG: hypothetical protein V3R54_04605 [Thermodesulfovibrionia bacterium]
MKTILKSSIFPPNPLTHTLSLPAKAVIRKVPSDIKKKIVKAIKDSPIVKPFIKKLIT